MFTLAWAVRCMLFGAMLVASGGCRCCASKYLPFATPAEVAPCGVAERVLIPENSNVSPAETVVKPANLETPFVDPMQGSIQLLPAVVDPSIPTFALPDAIAFGLANNPRLRAARAGIDRTRGQEQVAFSPFLPQVDLLSQTGVVSPTLAPGIPGATGFILAGGFGTRAYSETEAALQWTIYDFGRSSGRYGQAIARSQIAQLQLTRAVQTIEFDVATTYVDVLLARASRRVQDEAVLRAEAILHDTNARRVSGNALKEDVLRGEVQTSESREALVLAREGEFNSIARLNKCMGRNAGLPLEIVDLELEPPMPATLAQLLETAAAQRPEIAVARQMVEVAQQGWKAARGELLPRIYVRASGGRTDGENVITGWQEGAGLHLETPLYSGGRNLGEIRSAEADVQAAIADAQTLLDNISLEVNLAYRGVVAAHERISLSRVAVTQAEENMRLILVRYKNGNATPTDIVDSEAALTRSQQRFYSATYTYLAALARLDYALGQRQGTLLVAQAVANSPQKPAEELRLPEFGWMNRKRFEVEIWQSGRTWKEFGEAMMAFIGPVGDKLKAWRQRASKRFWSPRAWVSLVVLIILALVVYYILSDIYTPFTTDAYVQAYVVQVAPRVEGQVTRVCVEENQAVKKGALLFEIDPRPFEHSLELLVAKRVEAVQKVAQLKAELAAAQAEDERLKAEEGYAKVVNDQEKEIYKRDATTDRLYVQAVQKYKAAQAAIDRSRADVVKVEQALAALVGEEHALVAEVDAQLAQAKLNLEWTQIYAPANGYVTNVQLRSGSYVHVGSPVITFVDGDQWWIVANFRENEMRRIQAGQTARVAFRSAPASIYSAQVTSVGWGVSQGQGVPSGQLPDVKVPGNWVPPAQRFQIRVALNDPETVPMRVGMTGSVAVYTEPGNPLNLVTGLWHRVIAWLYHL